MRSWSFVLLVVTSLMEVRVFCNHGGNVFLVACSSENVTPNLCPKSCQHGSFIVYSLLARTDHKLTHTWFLHSDSTKANLVWASSISSSVILFESLFSSVTEESAVSPSWDNTLLLNKGVSMNDLHLLHSPNVFYIKVSIVQIIYFELFN